MRSTEAPIIEKLQSEKSPNTPLGSSRRNAVLQTFSGELRQHVLIECGEQSPADSSAHSPLFSATDRGADLHSAKGLDHLLH